MKKKDIVYLAIAAILFAIAGLFAFSQLSGNKGSKRTAEVEVITPIKSEFDGEALKQVTDPNQARDFSVDFDLTQGLNNATPFNPL